MKGNIPKPPGNFESIQDLADWINKNPEVIDAFNDWKEEKKTVHARVSDSLVLWVSSECRPENVKEIARSIGYNDTPMFFQKQRKAVLVSELVFLYTSMVIFAVNHFFKSKAKPTIDAYLEGAAKSIYAPIEKIYPEFKAEYEQRLATYFEDFQQRENPLLGIAYTFLSSLGISPTKAMSAQVFIAGHIGKKLEEIGSFLEKDRPIGFETPSPSPKDEVRTPQSIEYAVSSIHGKPCVVVKSQPIGVEGRSVGPSSKTTYSIAEIEQLVGFCLRCGNNELMKAVRRPVYAHLYGPDHQNAKS